MPKKPTYGELKKKIQKLEKSANRHIQVEQALEESEKRYWSLFENNHSVMLLIDPKTAEILDANPAALSFYGWNLHTLTRKKITEINTLTREEVLREIEKARNEQRQHFSFRHRLATGEIRDVDVYSGPVLLGGKELLYSIIHDTTERNQLEQKQRELNETLEEKVRERTAELQEMNTALKVLIKKREEDREELEEKVLANYKSLVLPFLDKLKGSLNRNDQQNLMAIIEANLDELLGPFSKKLSDPMVSLTPTEIQVAAMVKQGLSNKEISQTLHKSVRTISYHRDHIRKKLGLTHKKINLQSYLSTL